MGGFCWRSHVNNNVQYQLEDIDDAWQATDRATLLFIVKNNQVLLIRKKRGLGAGKINGPGGKLEAGETPVQCIIREVQEELGINVIDPQNCGRLKFQFTDGYSIDVSVFIAHDYSGYPQETDEAAPLWCALDAIPFDEMWEDDRVWLPRVLAGERVNGRFVFASDKMIAHDINFLQAETT